MPRFLLGVKSFLPLEFMPESNALISTSTKCPLCQSSARQQIDSLLKALYATKNESIIDIETGEITESDEQAEAPNYADTLEQVNLLLSKLPSHNTPEFGLTDLIVHVQAHPLISDVVGVQLRSEGALLFANERVYRKIDPIDFFDLALALATEKMMSGEMKITPTFITNAIATRWRMTGNAGNDPLIQGMLEKIQKGKVDPNSPLGKARTEREQSLSDSREVPELVPDPDDTESEE